MNSRIGAACALCWTMSAVAVSAAPSSPCSADTFSIEGTALTFVVCPAAENLSGPGKPAPSTSGELRETISVKGRVPLTRVVRYERLANEETARTLDDVPLAALGIERTMHVTLAIRSGDARLEHALLVPGAIPLK